MGVALALASVAGDMSEASRSVGGGGGGAEGSPGQECAWTSQRETLVAQGQAGVCLELSQVQGCEAVLNWAGSPGL